MDIPCHLDISPFIFCLRLLTAPTHVMGHRFSLTSAHPAQRRFCCAINVKSCKNFFSTLVPGRTAFQISIVAIHCHVLSQSIPSFSPAYCPCILFFDPFPISFTSLMLHSFGSTASEMLLFDPNSNCSLLSSHSSHN